MTIRDICEHGVITATRSMPITEAAQLMKEKNIGSIVIIDNEIDNEPIGILTDRDIAMKIVADDIIDKTICVGDIMCQDLLLLKEKQGINEALEMMCAKGVRRAPVIDENNKIVGIASADDLLILLADELSSLAKLVNKQVAH